MNKLVLIGAGGHGKVIADIALKVGYSDISFLDDNAVGKCMGFPICGVVANAERMNEGNTDYVIAVGNNGIRRKIADCYPNLNYVTLVHPNAVIGVHVSIGRGTVIMAGAIINPSVSIGEHNIINSGAIVEHDNVLEDYVHVSPNAALGGTVHVGTETHVGIGAIVRNNVNICSGCTIGAGAVVVKDITEEGIYIGIPARKMSDK